MSRYILIALCLSTIIGCNWKEEQATKILSKRRVREDLIQAFIKDSSYLTEFIDKLSKDSLGQVVLKNNTPLVKVICSSSAVDSLLQSDAEVNRLLAIKLVHRMEEDTASCKLMCGMVVENPVLRRHLKENICPEVLHEPHILK